MSPHSTSVFTAKEPVTGGRRRLTFSYSALTAAEMLVPLVAAAGRLGM